MKEENEEYRVEVELTPEEIAYNKGYLDALDCVAKHFMAVFKINEELTK